MLSKAGRKSRLKSVIILFVVQLVQYCIVSIGYIVMNRGLYVATFVADTVYGLNSFFIVKKIVNTEDTLGWEAGAYTLGGSIGSLLAIFLTKHWLHQ
jgi:hypothetical protein